MKKLPFKTEPRQTTLLVGDEESGTLEFPVLGGLKVGEQVLVDEAMRSLPNAFAEAARLAVRIDAELGLNDLLFAFDIVANPNWDQEQREEIEFSEASPKEKQKRLSELEARAVIFRSARIRYSPDMLELNKNTEVSGRAKQLAAVTAILAHRIDDSWQEEDTKGLSDNLFQKIWEFAQTEMNGGKTETTALTEEAVGKQPEENPTQTSSTGLTSTGESNATGVQIPDSVPTALAPSLVG
ncbi:MAG: hypothetical protein AB1861_08380 [Cyanobacteriota bacterium]